MRKHIKAQVQEALSGLTDNLNGFEVLIREVSREQVLDILAQMQELIVSVGNTVESWEGEGNPVVHSLEEACELVYQVSCSLDAEEDRRRVIHDLKRLIDSIRDDIENKIPVTLEVLFLPYQVSAWDSLESVWMAAKEDAGVRCFVVPLPFCDVRSDGTLGDMHYEGDRYPDYVPVTHYREYSVEERKPDMIFIHNPYDEWNSVTRVPEEYYARNLKRHTDKLVYIPYFVSEEGGPADHQCYSPGVMYADRVVVQPGRIYEKYCRIYTDLLNRSGWAEYFVPAEKKFLPLGSPKVDKLWRMSDETGSLRPDWQKVIQKPDGSRKKIILYNLSIGSFLKDYEVILQKIDNVFAFFRERQDELVLLWRPHPLLVSTIASMAPWLRDEYMRRIRRFKEEGWGIYDDTPDPNLAMALSDGYYGDPSSLLTIYRETGKPILLQDANILD